MFSLCLSVPGGQGGGALLLSWGRGVPQSLVPSAFWREGRGTPSLVLVGEGGTYPGRGYPSHNEYPPSQGQDMGTPSQTRYTMDRICRRWYASCGHAGLSCLIE